MPLEQPFSKRHRYSGAKEITTREDAPENLRYFVLQSAYEFGCWPPGLLETLCKLLRVVPHSNEEYEYQVRKEVEELLHRCEWYRIYDFIEFVTPVLRKEKRTPARGRIRPEDSRLRLMASSRTRALAGNSRTAISSRAEPKRLKPW